MSTKTTFALYFANRGFFPESLIGKARAEVTAALDQLGYGYIMMEESATKFGAIETADEGRIYAKFLAQNEGKYDGAIICLPNFGDENGAQYAFRECKVPIFIQAYPDRNDEMDFSQRRDSYCGKLSIMDVFYQFGIKYTAMKPHVVHPSHPDFAANMRDFAAVCNVVKAMRRFTLGAIGARTTAFKTVRYDELALQKYNITVDSYDLSELFSRVRSLRTTRSDFKARRQELLDFTCFDCISAEKLDMLAKVSVAIDDMIGEYKLDTISLRCWTEMQSELGIAPCVLLGLLNDKGIAASCEMDVCNAVMMRGLSAATGAASACLDWNNNYGDDPDKCILFHCGPVPQSMMSARGNVIDHKMFAKSYGEGCGAGANEGRIKAMPFTYASAKTENGLLRYYSGTGEFTSDELGEGFFGCGGVAKIDRLQDVLLGVGRNGYRHHVSASEGYLLAAVNEAFTNYLGYTKDTF